jgi:glutathione S-transferase
MIRLHDNLSSGNGYKVLLLSAQLGIPFERVEYDIDEGHTRTPEFLEKVNSNGRVPVLETEDGEFLPESNAILFYPAADLPRRAAELVAAQFDTVAAAAEGCDALAAGGTMPAGVWR